MKKFAAKVISSLIKYLFKYKHFKIEDLSLVHKIKIGLINLKRARNVYRSAADEDKRFIDEINFNFIKLNENIEKIHDQNV